MTDVPEYKIYSYTVNMSREEIAQAAKMKLLMQDIYGPVIKEQIEKNQALYDEFNDYLPTDPLEWADYCDRKREYESREMYLASRKLGVQRAVLQLHWPDERKQCQGCDYSGYEGEPPEWPCQTWNLVLHGNPKYYFQNIELTRRYKPGRSPKERSAKARGKYITIPIHTRRRDDGTVERTDNSSD